MGLFPSSDDEEERHLPTLLDLLERANFNTVILLVP
jgi:hypothetical protein